MIFNDFRDGPGHLIERAVLVGGRDSIHTSDLPERISQSGRPVDIDQSRGLKAALAHLERTLIRQALRTARNNKVMAARLLKVKRTTLLAKMSRLGL